MEDHKINPDIMEETITKWHMTMQETLDSFYFDSILPFCQSISRAKLSKKDLMEVIFNYQRLKIENNFLRQDIKELEKQIDILQNKILELTYNK